MSGQKNVHLDSPLPGKYDFLNKNANKHEKPKQRNTTEYYMKDTELHIFSISSEIGSAMRLQNYTKITLLNKVIHINARIYTLNRKRL